MTHQKKSFKLLFITDPLENFHPQSETTLYMMRQAQRRGYQVWQATPQAIFLKDSQIQVKAQHIKLKPGKNFYQLIQSKKLTVLKFNGVLLRKDPPFDVAFLEHLYLLSKLEGQIYLGNRPSGLLHSNEKLFALDFPQYCPPTLVTAQWEEMLSFIKKQPSGAILKPLNQSGGQGVYYLKSASAENLKLILEASTQGYQRHVLLQQYLPKAQKGDKRILLLEGEVLGAFRRVPAAGEHRANLHSGGQAKTCKLSAQDKKLIRFLKPELINRGLDFVGLDLIDGQLIEINVTSPMGFHELKTLYGHDYSREYFDFLEKEKL